jgi:hypothetical protein
MFSLLLHTELREAPIGLQLHRREISQAMDLIHDSGGSQYCCWAKRSMMCTHGADRNCIEDLKANASNHDLTAARPRLSRRYSLSLRSSRSGLGRIIAHRNSNGIPVQTLPSWTHSDHRDRVSLGDFASPEQRCPGVATGSAFRAWSCD